MRFIRRSLGAIVAVATVLVGVASASPRTGLIAYSVGTNSPHVVVATTTGKTVRHLGAGNFAQISPDGRFVAGDPAGHNAMQEPTGAGLAIWAVSGGRPHTFFRAAFGLAAKVAWSHDSRYVAVVIDDENTNQDSLVVVDTQTWTTTTIRSGGQIEGVSFSPTADRLAYGWAVKLRSDGSAPADLFDVNANGQDAHVLTHGGDSLNPVWSRAGIYFDQQRARGADSAPAWELALLVGRRRIQLTHVRDAMLSDGPEPVAASASGGTLIASEIGQDEVGVWCVRLHPLRAVLLSANHDLLQPAGISADGRQLLVVTGNPFQSGVTYRPRVATVSCAGTGLHTIASGDDASWDL